jgi:uncharacterized repeat protein (TIGR01451 family)
VSGDNNSAESGLSVEIGSIADGESVTITFEAVVKNPLPAGITELSAQGFVSSDTLTNLPTDDPETDTQNDATITPVVAVPAIAATKAAAWLDQNEDEQVNFGDVLTYTVTVTNDGSRAATDVGFNDTLDSNTILVENSVTTTHGTITSGNGTDDTEVVVDIGTLAGGGESVTIIFEALITNSVSLTVTEVSNQGTVVGSNFIDVPTDDPATDRLGDPTVTQVGP